MSLIFMDARAVTSQKRSAPPIPPAPGRRRRLAEPRHTAVAGRMRFHIRGLRRSEYLASRLKLRLSPFNDIRLISVSSVTGSILIISLKPEASLEVVRDRLDALLFAELEAAARGDLAPQPTKLRAQSDGQEGRTWYQLPAARAAAVLRTSAEHGLTATEALRRQKEFGANQLGEQQPRSNLDRLIGQVANMPCALLASAATLALATGAVVDAALILTVLTVNTSIGYATERHTDRIISSMDTFDHPAVQVLRDGKTLTISAEMLVPGDVVLLHTGPVPADIRLINATNLSVDESALTGESMPVMKTDAALESGDLALADRRNMLYRGTVIVGGSGRGVVVATGDATEAGRINTLVGSVKPPETPLQSRLRLLGAQTVIISTGICAAVLIIGLWRRLGFYSMLKTAISLAIAAVPEGLPTVGTTTLALGVGRLRQRDVLVRRLAAVENLGAISMLCFDKTGTVTQNRMAVQAIVISDRRLDLAAGTPPDLARGAQELHLLGEVALLCNDAPELAVGSPSATESALVNLAQTLGLDVEAERRSFPRLKTRYRSEAASLMATLHQAPEGGMLLAVKGSPEDVLARCDRYMSHGQVLPLDEHVRSSIVEANACLSSEALRVLAVAYRADPDNESPEHLVWLALIGLQDPLRPGVRNIIDAFHDAGIGTALITGDQESTAIAISRKLGLGGATRDDLPTVYSRVSPTDKLRIVQAMQRAGHIVGMAGDGVNDSPALRAADIGIAMGAGANVAREAAEVVLGGDDLPTLYEAVRQGRAIRDNLGKAIHFLLATNLSEILLTFGGVALGSEVPLNPRHLLWINLLTDVFPALALAVDAPNPDVMTREPRDPDSPLFAAEEWTEIGVQATAMAVGAASAYFMGERHSAKKNDGTKDAATRAFVALTVAQLLHAESSRSRRRTLFAKDPLPANPQVNLAVGLGLAAQVLSVLLPPLRYVLGNAKLGLGDFSLACAFGVAPLLVTELIKSLDEGRMVFENTNIAKEKM